MRRSMDFQLGWIIANRSRIDSGEKVHNAILQHFHGCIHGSHVCELQLEKSVLRSSSVDQVDVAGSASAIQKSSQRRALIHPVRIGDLRDCPLQSDFRTRVLRIDLGSLFESPSCFPQATEESWPSLMPVVESLL